MRLKCEEMMGKSGMQVYMEVLSSVVESNVGVSSLEESRSLHVYRGTNSPFPINALESVIESDDMVFNRERFLSCRQERCSLGIHLFVRNLECVDSEYSKPSQTRKLENDPECCPNMSAYSWI